MKKEPLQNLKQRTVRCILAILALLTMPAGMWAEDYPITVAGVQVTDENATTGITGDNIYGTVTYDAENHILTLANVEITGFIYSGLEALTIELTGTNTISGGIQSNNESEGDLNFTGTGSLEMTGQDGDSPVKYFENVTIGSGLYLQTNEPGTHWDGQRFSANGNGLSTLMITPTPYYPIWVISDGVYYTQVSEANKGHVLGESNTAVTYDSENDQLILNNFVCATTDGEYAICLGDQEEFKIHLLGDNRISGGGVSFANEEASLVFSTDAQDPGTLTIVQPQDNSYRFTSIGEAAVSYQNGLGYTNNVVSTGWTRLTIGGTAITGTTQTVGGYEGVSFDAETNTLTLNGADITVESQDAIVSCLKNLTVFLVGDNNITCYGNNTIAFNKSSDVDDATVTFTTDRESNGSLYVTIPRDHLFGEGVTPAFTNLSWKENGDYHDINSKLGISVGGVDVTYLNKNDVLGDGKVSFTPAVPATDTTPAVPAILTLNGATIEPEEEQESPGIAYENEEDLTIALIGNNSVKGSNGCSAISYYGNGNAGLFFAKGNSDQHFSLTLIADSEYDRIDGFNKNNGEDFFIYDEEDDGTFTTTISSSIFGGTGSADEPFLINTPEDLKNFANYYNDGKYFSRNSHIKLNNDIDCDGEEGFTPFADNSGATFCGVFDGNNKTISNLTMTGVGLFGHVEKDGDNVGTIKDLALDNFTLSGGDSSSSDIGGIAGNLNGGTITNCKLLNSSISCLANSQVPTVGGIVGSLYNGLVSSCICQNSSIKAQTSDTGASGANANAGGIAGAIIDGTISGCQVNGTTTVLADYGNYSASVTAGAIVAKMNGGTLTNNTYEYSVTTTTITYNDNTETTDTTVKKDYEQRGTGTETAISDEFYYDIVEDNGAVLYNTKKLTIAHDNIVEYGPAFYYEPLSNYQKSEFYLIPGQETTVMLQPADGYSISSASLTYAETEGADPTAHAVSNSAQEGYQFTFTMPDADAIFNASVSAKPSIWIGNIEVAQDGSFPEYGDNASFDFDTNTLTLNGLGYSGYIKSGLDHLTIRLVSNEYGNALGQVISLNPEATLTFVKASNDATGELGTLSAPNTSNSVIEGFASVDFGDLNLLSAPYQYDATAKKLINLSLTNDEDRGITSATLTTATAYPLWVAGNQVTGESVTGDGISKNGEVDEWGVTFSSNTLLLKNVYLSTAKDQTPAIVSGLDALTLQVEGYNSMSFGDYNTYGGFIVQSTNSAATLTVEAVDDASSLNLTFGTDLYINNPFNNFSSVTYSGKTIYVPGTGCQFVSNIKTPYYNNGDNVTISSADGDYGRNVISYYYTIDYVDEAKTDISTPTLLEEYLPSISSPCTVTAYAQYSYNGVTKTSDNAIAKYFGFTEPMKVVYAGTPVELDNLPALAPAVAEGDGVTYAIDGVSEGEAISFYAETGKYRVEDYGTAILNISIAAGDNTPYKVLNEVTNLTVNVIPPLYVAPIEDIAYTGSPVTPTIVVKASEEAETTLTVGTDYTVSYKLGEDAITADDLVDVATYTVVITGVGDYAGTKEVTFDIIKVEPTITFAQESYSAILGETFTSPETVDSWTVTPTASSNTSVATVSDGLITLVGVGTTTITVTYAETANYNSTTASYQLVVSRALDVAFVGSNSWASYYATENLAVPQGLTAYIVSDVNKTSGVVTVQTVGYIPANNGVLLQREANGAASGYVAAPYTGTTSTFNNLLAGSAEATNVSSLNGSPVYVLFNDKFKRATSGTIPARRAYLLLAVASAGAPQLMTLNVMDGISTGISTLATDDNDGSWYTIDGLKLSGKPQHKGIYIKKGQKVFFNNK